MAFFRAYAGSGLVIHCLARFHRMPRRFRALRIVSPDRTRGERPLAKQTVASRSSVQRLVGWSKVRGDWRRIARSGSATDTPKSGRFECGREDFARRQSRSSRRKAWMALRAVGPVQRRVRAIAVADWPSALARRV